MLRRPFLTLILLFLLSLEDTLYWRNLVINILKWFVKRAMINTVITASWTRRPWSSGEGWVWQKGWRFVCIGKKSQVRHQRGTCWKRTYRLRQERTNNWHRSVGCLKESGWAARNQDIANRETGRSSLRYFVIFPPAPSIICSQTGLELNSLFFLPP